MKKNNINLDNIRLHRNENNISGTFYWNIINNEIVPDHLIPNPSFILEDLYPLYEYVLIEF